MADFHVQVSVMLSADITAHCVVLAKLDSMLVALRSRKGQFGAREIIFSCY